MQISPSEPSTDYASICVVQLWIHGKFENADSTNGFQLVNVVQSQIRRICYYFICLIRTNVFWIVQIVFWIFAWLWVGGVWCFWFGNWFWFVFIENILIFWISLKMAQREFVFIIRQDEMFFLKFDIVLPRNFWGKLFLI